ncbi:MAG: hypothetical protein ACD_75C02389G0003 [uncultured bacterium]|nr:MAG: hypothetical protein ACD_75C02389G0003 [uncultured bacterium]HBG19587.1 hypothetical protein [Desulfobulbaceae bacterium]
MDRFNASEKRQPAVYLAWFQGVYYAVAGIWPILHIDSFMMVTGPKTDIWLVHTVGLLLVAVGVVLCIAAYRQRLTLELIVLAVGAALALTGIELFYTWKKTISMVYLLDAAVETLLIAGWQWLGFPSVKGTK